MFKGLGHNLKRLRHVGPTISLIGWVIRLYVGAIVSARFNFRYVHDCLENEPDHKEIPVENESLRALLYIDKDYDENEVFHSRIGIKIQALKAKGDTITNSDTLSGIIFRGMLTILSIKHTNKLPPHLQTTHNVLALTYVFPWMTIENKYYTDLESVKSLVHFNFPPESEIDASWVSPEIVDYILGHAINPSRWITPFSLSDENKVELLRKSTYFDSNDPRFFPATKEGMLKYPMDYVWRVVHLHQPRLQEIVGLCNKNAIKFDLGRTTQESNGIMQLLKYGLNQDLINEEELGLLNLKNFTVDRINLEVMTSAKNTDQWSRHIERMTKSFSADDWLDLEKFIDRYPDKGHLVNREDQTLSMVISRFSQKKAPSYYFNLIHKGCLDAVPFLVNEKPDLIPKIIEKNDGKDSLITAFFAEIEKMPELPAFVEVLTTPELLRRACTKLCLYSRAKLKNVALADVLACASTQQQFEFINRYLAPATVERHVELYPTSMHDDLLMSDLGL